MLFFTPRSIISSLLTTLLFASSSFANPIESTDSHLEERSSPFKAWAGDADGTPIGSYVVCYVDRIDSKSHKNDGYKWRITVKDTKKEHKYDYPVYGKCRFYWRKKWWDSDRYDNKKGYPYEYRSPWFTEHRKKITHVQAYACVDDKGKDTCKWGDKVKVD